MTTLAAIEEALPNGFHDSALLSIQLNIERGLISLSMLIDTSDTDMQLPIFKRADLHISDVSVFSCDPAILLQPMNRRVTVSGFIPTEKEFPGLCDLPETARQNIYSFFIVQWNGFLHISDRSAELYWREDG